MSNPANDDDADGVAGLSPAAREFEAALSRLQPVSAVSVNKAVDPEHAGLAYRDKVMFRAGQAAGEQKERAAGRRQLWAWRGAAAALAAVSIAVSARFEAQPRRPVQVVYVHGSLPPARATVEGPARRETTNVSSEPQYGQTDSGPGYAITGTPPAGWLGVRGDYLSTRAAVLRWGVTALPRVEDSAGDGPTPTPLDEIKKLFWHKTNGGRL